MKCVIEQMYKNTKWHTKGTDISKGNMKCVIEKCLIEEMYRRTPNGTPREQMYPKLKL